MHQDLFDLSRDKELEDLKRIEPKARQVYRRYMEELAIHRRVSRLNY